MSLQSACWAMAKSWLDVQVDLELARSQPGRMEQLKSYGDGIDGSPGQMDSASHSTIGPENWPLHVLNQQPRNLSALLQKLHSGYICNLLFQFHSWAVCYALCDISTFLHDLVKWLAKLLLEGARSSNGKLRFLFLQKNLYTCMCILFLGWDVRIFIIYEIEYYIQVF